MSTRRAALLLGSAGVHAAGLALLVLVSVKAGFPPVLVLDLSAWEAATPWRSTEAGSGRRATDGEPGRRPQASRGAPAPGAPPLLGMAGSPAVSEVARPVLHRSPPGAASESAPSRALAGSAAVEPAPERQAPAPAAPHATRPEGSARAHPASQPGEPLRSGAEAVGPWSPGSRAVAGRHGGAESAGPGQGGASHAGAVAGAAGGAGTGASSGGRDGRSGLGLSGGSRLALVAPGDGHAGVPPEYGPYLARFRQRVQDALVYPLAARRRGLAGTVELDVLIDPAGRVQTVKLSSSSSHAMLDEAAMDTVREMTPLPLPETLPARPLRVKLPLVFELR